MEFKVGDYVEVRNPEGSEDTDWHVGKVRTVEPTDGDLPYAVFFAEADDGSGWYWVTPRDIRPLPVQQEVWQYKAATAEDWQDLNCLDGTTIAFPSYCGEAHVTFRRKPKYPEHTAEEIVAKMVEFVGTNDYPSAVAARRILRGEF